MTALDPNQLSVARLLFSLPSARGDALAGGAALLAVGVIDRPTCDVDAFVAARPGASPGDVRPLVGEAVPRSEITSLRMIPTDFGRRSWRGATTFARRE